MPITTVEGLRNLMDNVRPLMMRLDACRAINRPRSATLKPGEINDIVSFYTEVRYFMAEYHPQAESPILKQFKAKLKKLKAQTHGFTTDHESGYYDGQQAAYEDVIEQLETKGE